MFQVQVFVFVFLSVLLSYVACISMHMPRATLFYLYLKNKETEEESLRNIPNVIQLLSESIRNQTQCVLILYALLTKLWCLLRHADFPGFLHVRFQGEMWDSGSQSHLRMGTKSLSYSSNHVTASQENLE